MSTVHRRACRQLHRSSALTCPSTSARSVDKDRRSLSAKWQVPWGLARVIAPGQVPPARCQAGSAVREGATTQPGGCDVLQVGSRDSSGPQKRV